METELIDERAPAAILADTADDMLDVVVGLERCIAAMTALRAHAIDQTHAWFRSSQLATPRAGTWDAATTAQRVTVSELAAALRIPESAAGRLLVESTALVRDLPATLAVLGKGEISYRHATVMVDNAQTLPPEALADYEAPRCPRPRTCPRHGFGKPPGGCVSVCTLSRCPTAARRPPTDAGSPSTRHATG